MTLSTKFDDKNFDASKLNREEMTEYMAYVNERARYNMFYEKEKIYTAYVQSDSNSDDNSKISSELRSSEITNSENITPHAHSLDITDRIEQRKNSLMNMGSIFKDVYENKSPPTDLTNVDIENKNFDTKNFINIQEDEKEKQEKSYNRVNEQPMYKNDHLTIEISGESPVSNKKEQKARFSNDDIEESERRDAYR